MHKKLLISKLQKIANVLDENNFYKQADQLTLVMKKVAQIDPDSIRDLKKINDNNNVPNDLLFYAAAVTQAVKNNPLYDADNYNITLDKIKSIASNPYVIRNFPNITNNINATIAKLQEKTPGYEQADASSSSSGSSVATLSPGSGYSQPAENPQAQGKIKLKGVKPLLKKLAENKENLRRVRAIIALIPGFEQYTPILDLIINADTNKVDKIIDDLDNDKIKDITSLLKNPAAKTIIQDNFNINLDDVEGLLTD